MVSFKENKLLPMFILFATLTLVLIVFLIVRLSFSADLTNDSEVEPDTPLTYYLNVYYDGVDRLGVESSDSVVSEIRSGYIFVEDKIPEGLTFTSFVTTEDGTIGAVDRNLGESCIGSVVDDTNEASVTEGVWNQGNTEYTYHGLHYNKTDNKVSFKVRNLKAGCVLTVGIITQTPEEIDDPLTVEVETRRDFYNTANARENSLSVNSNTLHAFMGSQSSTLYTVSYQYTGSVPSGAVSVLPSSVSYEENAKVNVANDVNVEGYTFSGWSASGLTITDGVFTMPSTNVVLTGSFTEISKNTVTYEVEEPLPSNYEVPDEKEYYPNSSVDLDTMKQGDVFNGYRFSGWSSEDITLDNEDNFIMPNKDVLLRGEFEVAKYNITYAFYDTVLPPNSSLLLPEPEEYEEGEDVTLPTVSSQPGYEFLGWYHEDNFEMGNEDITIYGEWRSVDGEFEVEIEKEIVNPQDYYNTGNIVLFRITVTNPNNFALTDVIVKELNDGTVYEPGSNYTITSDHFVTISNLAANGSVVIDASYTVTQSDTVIENTVQVMGALAVNGYVLADEEYTSTVTFGKQPIIRVCNYMNPDLGNKIKYKLSSSDGEYETWLNLSNSECKETKVEVGSYLVKELVPQEYEIDSVTGSVSEDNTSFAITAGQIKQINYNNVFVNKGFLHSSGSKNNVIISNPMSYVYRQTEGIISVGDKISIKNEMFYVVSSDQNTTSLLAEYNLLVGDIYNYDDNLGYASYDRTLNNLDIGYGLQNEDAKGWILRDYNQSTANYVGIVGFSGTNYWDSSDCIHTGTTWDCTGTNGLLPEYSPNGERYWVAPFPNVYNSNYSEVAPSLFRDGESAYVLNGDYSIAYYVENYVNLLKDFGAPNSISGRLLTYDEAVSLGCVESELICSSEDVNNGNAPTSATAPSWIYSTSYWLETAVDYERIWAIENDAFFSTFPLYESSQLGVRPVIEVPTSVINSISDAVQGI